MSEDQHDPQFELPPGLSEVEVIQVARQRGLLTEEEIQIARGARVREARREIYRSVFVYLIETGAVTEHQLHRLIEELAAMDRPDQPLGYRFLQKLGSGSMGTVYLAVQECLDRVVAVKMLARQYARNKHYVERFEREAMLGAEAASPYFPAVYDAGRWRGQQYMSMEYVRGDSIEAQLAAGRRYTPEEVIDLAIEMTFALEYLHSLSIVHRDVKPQNIVIGHDGQLKLMDLGLARKLNDTVQIDAEKGNAVGTPFYISPEQIRGLDVDERTDLYSLGCTMYHLLVGAPPFQAPQTSLILEQHLHKEVEPPSARADGVPRNLERMVLWLMEKDPNRRKAAARKVRHELLTIEAQLNPAAFRLKRGVARVVEEDGAAQPHGLGAEQYASQQVPLPKLDLENEPEPDDVIDTEEVAREVFGEELDSGDAADQEADRQPADQDRPADDESAEPEAEPEAAES